MNRISQARKAAGLSQKYVAMALGVSGPSVCNWESGKTQPTPENLRALADLCNVSVDYLLGRDVSASIKNDPPSEREVDDVIAALASDLTQDEMQRVCDFVAGLIAARRP